MDVETVVGGALELGIFELLRQRLTTEKIVASPAAGAEWSLAVPARTTWEVLSVRHKLTTSAVVANRAAGLKVSDPNGLTLYQLSPQAVIAASLNSFIDFLPGLGATEAIQQQQALLPTPAPILTEGWTIGSLTGNIDVGDQYSGIVLTVREWTLDAMERSSEWLAEQLR